MELVIVRRSDKYGGIVLPAFEPGHRATARTLAPSRSFRTQRQFGIARRAVRLVPLPFVKAVQRDCVLVRH